MDKLILNFNKLLHDRQSSQDLYYDGQPWGSLEWQSCETPGYWIWWYEPADGLEMIGLCQHIVTNCESPAIIEVVVSYTHGSTSDETIFRHLDLACQENRPILLQMGFREIVTDEGCAFQWCPVTQHPPRQVI